MGMTNWPDIIGFFIGVSLLVNGVRRRQKGEIFLAGWLLISPLAAAITRDPVHARRAFNMVYPFTLVTALGMTVLWTKLNIIGKGLILLSYCWCVGFYLVSYYISTPVRTAEGSAGWQYGYKELVEYISPLAKNYQNIVIDNYYQGPYIFFLWYQQYSPRRYQSQATLVKSDSKGLGEGSGYDKYQFRTVYWPADRGEKGYLYAAAPDRIPLKDIDSKQARIITTIYFPNGKPAYFIVETY